MFQMAQLFWLGYLHFCISALTVFNPMNPTWDWRLSPAIVAG
jgi:hypothetical protein